VTDNKFGDVGGNVDIQNADKINQAGNDIVEGNKTVINHNHYYYGQEPSPSVQAPVLAPEARVALINRAEQWDKHIKQRLKTEKNRKNFAFVVAAVKEEWPESLKHRLALHLRVAKPYSLNLDSPVGNPDDWKHHFQRELLKYFSLPDLPDETDYKRTKQCLLEQLAHSDTSVFFYCLLKPDMTAYQAYLQTLVSCWESLDLTHAKKQHVLLIIYGTKEKGFLNFGERKVEKWRKTLLAQLSKKNHLDVVVPTLLPPSREDVNYWINKELHDSLEQTQFEKAFESMKGERIPHLKLKQTYIEIAKSKA
jgi:hypothetical protein